MAITYPPFIPRGKAPGVVKPILGYPTKKKPSPPPSKPGLKYWPEYGWMPTWWKPAGTEVKTPTGGVTRLPEKPVPTKIPISPELKERIKIEKEIMAARAKVHVRETVTPEHFEMRRRAAEFTPTQREAAIHIGAYGLGLGAGAVAPILPVAGRFGLQAVGAVGTGLYAGTLIKEKRLPTSKEMTTMWMGGMGLLTGMGLAQPKTEAIELGKIARKKDVIGIKSKVVTKAGLKKYKTEIKTAIKPLPSKGEYQRAIGISEFRTEGLKPGIAASKIISKAKGEYVSPKVKTVSIVGKKEMLSAAKGLVRQKKGITGMLGKTITEKGQKGISVSFFKEQMPPTPGLKYTPGKKTFSAITGSIAESIKTSLPKPKPIVPIITPSKVKKRPITRKIGTPGKIEFKLKQPTPKQVVSGFPKSEVTYPHKITISKQLADVGEAYKSSALLGRVTKRRRRTITGVGQVPITTTVKKQMPILIQPSPRVQIQPTIQRQVPLLGTRTGLRQITKAATIHPPSIFLPPSIPGIFGIPFGWPRVKGRGIGIKLKPRKRKLVYTPGLEAFVTGKEWKKFPKKLTGLEPRWFKKKKLMFKLPKMRLI